MTFNKPTAFILFVMLCSLSSVALSLASDRDAPINIEADSGEMDQAMGRTTYIGNVIITQGSMKLVADKVTVQYKDKKPYQLTAIGKPAHFEQKPDESKPLVYGQGNTLQYMMQSEELILIDNAELRQGKDSFVSDRIVYDRAKAKLKGGAAADGKERIKFTIQPSDL